MSSYVPTFTLHSLLSKVSLANYWKLVFALHFAPDLQDLQRDKHA